MLEKGLLERLPKKIQDKILKYGLATYDIIKSTRGTTETAIEILITYKTLDIDGDTIISMIDNTYIDEVNE